jgi:ubiquinone/menaquinone biosynthesis C-methylase UbiE
VDPESLIQEQIQYYRRRASEYDETSSPTGDPLAVFGEEIEHALHAFKPTVDVLEIASGTGTWTRLLLQHASSIDALDAAPEMHQQSRRKLGDDPRVRYIEADVLSWAPDRYYDVVFFSNWLSHVPPGRFDHFWATVRGQRLLRR